MAVGTGHSPGKAPGRRGTLETWEQLQFKSWNQQGTMAGQVGCSGQRSYEMSCSHGSGSWDGETVAQAL